MNIFALMVAKAGELFAGLGSNMCAFFWLDEPETPKSLIK